MGTSPTPHLGHVGLAGVQHIQHKLLAAQQPVGHELQQESTRATTAGSQQACRAAASERAACCRQAHTARPGCVQAPPFAVLARALFPAGIPLCRCDIGSQLQLQRRGPASTRRQAPAVAAAPRRQGWAAAAGRPSWHRGISLHHATRLCCPASCRPPGRAARRTAPPGCCRVAGWHCRRCWPLCTLLPAGWHAPGPPGRPGPPCHACFSRAAASPAAGRASCLQHVPRGGPPAAPLALRVRMVAMFALCAQTRPVPLCSYCRQPKEAAPDGGGGNWRRLG